MKHIKSLMLGATLFASSISFGNTYTNDNDLVWTYTTSSGKATLTGVSNVDGTALDGSLTIPSSVNGVTVEAIGVNAFQDMAITNLVFEEGLKTIESGAFANCTALEALTLPDSLTTINGGGYGHYGAFNGCTALTSVHLGSGLVMIGNGYGADRDDNPDPFAYCGVFGNCINLEEVTFGPNLLKIGHHAFSECHALALWSDCLPLKEYLWSL